MLPPWNPTPGEAQGPASRGVASCGTARERLDAAMHLVGEQRLDAALAQVASVRADAPDHPRALLIESAILRVQARYDEALTACRRLAAVHPSLVVDICVLDLRSLAGDATALGQARRRVLLADGAAGANPAIASWMHSVLAEMADRAGATRVAEAHLRAAVASDGSARANAAFARWLLDERRIDEAVATLRRIGADADEAPNALTLCWVIAVRRIGAPDGAATGVPGDTSDAASAGAAAVGRLRARFAATDSLGDRAALRERTLFELEVANDTRTALACAQRNWALRKEPIDARLLAHAARAADDAVVLGALAGEIRHTGMSDRRLDVLLRPILQA